MARAFLLASLLLVVAPAADAANGSTLFRLFLTDGSSLVSFGEFAKLDDQVIFSMPLGGPVDQPRLYVVTVPASRIDWAKTDRYSTSARSKWYADTRGEQEFQQLSSDVARVLNEVALSTDRRRALEIAENARKVLFDWPASHFGYRQTEVREIVSLLDEAISDLRATLGISSFDVALVATPAAEGSLEPLLGTPALEEQIRQVFRVVSLTERSADRVSLLRAALNVIDESAATLPESTVKGWRKDAEGQIRRETGVDTAYASLSRKMMESATKAASSANVSAVERMLDDLRAQDEKLGHARPETVDAVRASLQAQLEAARSLRLRRDQWVIRRALYSDYQRSVGSQVRQLARLKPSLEAIRRLEGPSPGTLQSLRKRLNGGADRLQKLSFGVPSDLREIHDLLVSAWRFSEKAVDARSTAVSTGNLSTAWEASSAAAGALLMLSRAQHDLNALIELPQLQ